MEAQLIAERGRVITEESRKARLAAAAELDHKTRELAEPHEMLKGRDEKLAVAQEA
jgi:hypothetical protein